MKIKSGDTLSQIAKDNNISLKALLAANPSIKNANQIRVGQSITIPPKPMGNASSNPYKGMTRSEMKALQANTNANKAKQIVKKSKGKLRIRRSKGADLPEQAEKRARSATRNARFRAARERNQNK